jgi:TrmH family RNA methyltransferase
VRPYDAAFAEARSAVGGGPLLRAARVFDSLAEAVADCTLVVGTTSIGHRELKHKLRRLEIGSRLIRSERGRVALLFGSEKFGLSNDDLSHCHWLVRIATTASMNLGQAVAVCLYELARDARAIAKSGERRAKSDELARLDSALLEALTLSGYVNERTSASTERKLRRMVRRLNLSPPDAEAWLGMLRQILWKLRGR